MQFQVGDLLEGKVTGIKKFGAFVRLPCGTTGMVHISEVSSDYIEDLTEVLCEGQQVQVKVMGISDAGKVSLSMKKTEEPSPRKIRADQGKTWQPKAKQASDNLSFEDMMSRFKTQSEEKISDLRKAIESRGGGYSRRR